MPKPTNFIEKVSSKEALPLGWTRIVRRRKRKEGEANGGEIDDNSNESNNNVDEEICCIDETCLRIEHNSSKRLRSETSAAPTSPVMIEGQVIFCLQDTDPSWLQGYFFPKTSLSSMTSPANGMGVVMPSSSYIKPWGLLATQQELDDCLACADGGFRQITLKIYKPGVRGGGRGATDKGGSNSKGPQLISDIDWTGGDMMRLSHEDGFVTMETDRLLVGNSALPYLSKYFAKLIEQLRKDCDVEVSTPILEWMPDVAILVGTMSISSLALSENESTPVPKKA